MKTTKYPGMRKTIKDDLIAVDAGTGKATGAADAGATVVDAAPQTVHGNPDEAKKPETAKA